MMVRLPPVVVAFWMIFLGGLMVSRLPTLSLKGWRVAPAWVGPIFLGVVLLTAAMITNPWLTLSGVGTAYMLSLPCGWILYRKERKRERKHD